MLPALAGLGRGKAVSERVQGRAAAGATKLPDRRAGPPRRRPGRSCAGTARGAAKLSGESRGRPTCRGDPRKNVRPVTMRVMGRHLRRP